MFLCSPYEMLCVLITPELELGEANDVPRVTQKMDGRSEEGTHAFKALCKAALLLLMLCHLPRLVCPRLT